MPAICPAPVKLARPGLIGSRLVLLSICLVGLICLTACVQLPPAPSNAATTGFWSGRLSLQVHSEPPQSLTAGFELKGSPEQGEFVLSSPLGNTLLAARWTPLEATLYSAEKPRSFKSIDALIEQSTGAALPVAALFDWVAGKPSSLNGWTADLRQQAQGRISARRSSPLPSSDLRIVLDRPSP